ncbi:MAG: hypothetical protein P1U84_12100 [Parvibaculaceae bacterium]|nr:hypothetical protein [Parvibaculaceae bacterium]
MVRQLHPRFEEEGLRTACARLRRVSYGSDHRQLVGDVQTLMRELDHLFAWLEGEARKDALKVGRLRLPRHASAATAIDLVTGSLELGAAICCECLETFPANHPHAIYQCERCRRAAVKQRGEGAR